MKLLQNRLDDTVVDVISLMLSRNPQCKLRPEDVQVCDTNQQRQKKLIVSLFRHKETLNEISFWNMHWIYSICVCVKQRECSCTPICMRGCIFCWYMLMCMCIWTVHSEYGARCNRNISADHPQSCHAVSVSTHLLFETESSSVSSSTKLLGGITRLPFPGTLYQLHKQIFHDLHKECVPQELCIIYWFT